ncbi:hypothetical protein MYCTH_102448 [Thermothelomyces thermophilus ATCC 42464]|uniref:Uncharacterized protein n=1 Tax=Thermothelomyces thermophilus (strain ATCC 42464 / BCRC 31852 / DSM 1799) TaxID=573729 RepID=G2QFE2_THET4|nr:uncharacterized protein MYCTH_102448 [Thermothelomyces thermophilus ATCC 42464]AEO59171.1 hypothetical protein MYCTH_102448 [Thermothelomyces thermophilus ATCC 42464]
MPEYRTGQGRHMAARLFDRIQYVERLTGISMEEETRQLQTTCGILNDLNTRLCEAIDLWSQMSFDDGSCEELTQTQASAAQSPSPNPPAEELKELPRQPKCQHSTPPSLGDPAVGTQSRYQTQWKNWIKAPAIQDPASLILSRPTRWWMEERSHYALCQPSEQAQLESSADAVRLHRAYNHATLPVVALPAPAQYYQSSGREKNLRPGNIWTDPPRRPMPDDEPVSPRAVPASWSGCFRPRDTCPFPYSPEMNREYFRCSKVSNIV